MRPEILTATVGHERFTPVSNRFSYSVYYVIVPVTDDPLRLPRLFGIDRSSLLSIRTSDHGAKGKTTWRRWIKETCGTRGLPIADDDTVLLIAHPRILGYAFNPISHWLIFEKDGYLKGVLCEVHNTFGDDHNYLLHRGGAEITPAHSFAAPKRLYVSPFNTVPPGSYRFRFEVTPDRFASHIDYLEDGTRLLATYLGGTRAPLTPRTIIYHFIRYPLMTVHVVVRIHYQALRLWLKGLPHTLATRPPHTTRETTLGTEITTAS